MKFKDILEKAEVYKEICDMLVNGYLPLTPEISLLLNSNDEIITYHLTSLEHLKNFNKLKPQDAISTFTKGLNSVVNNVIVKSDVMLKLKGNIVLKADKDLYSYPDKSGMRWINLEPLHIDVKKYRFLIEAFTNKVDKNLCDKWLQMSDKEQDKITNTYKEHILRLLKKDMYYNMLLDILKDNKSNKYKHNEVIVNNVKVIEVYSIETGRYQYDHSTAKKTIESLGYKYVDHIEKPDFNKF